MRLLYILSACFLLVLPADAQTVTQVSAGNLHTCVRTSTGGVRCWGRGDVGQLGYVNTDDIGDDETPAMVGAVNVGASVNRVATGTFHTCALTSTGGVRCWGAGTFGRLGYGNTDAIGDDEAPSTAGDVSIGPTAIQISAGGNHTCVRTSAGAVRCWGENLTGQLGYGNTDNIGDDELPATAGDVSVFTAAELSGGATAAQVAVGGLQTCVVTNTGTVRCWGVGSFGRLGYGNTNTIGDDEVPSSLASPDVSVGAAVTQVAGGRDHTCTVTTTGTVRCWGRSNVGQLGYGNTNTIGDDEVPSSLASPDVSVGLPVTQISAGDAHTCAVTTSGTVRCWGNGTDGQLGYSNTDTIGDDEAPSTAGDVNVGLPVTQVSAGAAHTCALTNAGTVRCWGGGGIAPFPNVGQLGYGNTDAVGDDPSRSIIAAGDVPIFAPGLPVELTSFDAVLAGSTARLSWSTATETDNTGFEVQRVFSRDGQTFWDVLDFVPGASTTTEAQSYSFDVSDLEPGRHGFRLKQIDFDGAFEFSETVEVVVDVPGTHVLEAAYPNPFNPRTTFAFLVAETQPVRATLHDAQGRLVKTLYDDEAPAGEKVWVRVNADGLASGTYLYRIEGRNFAETKSVQLVR
ncbi:MAG: T9SS type A sorting domain-containing protein [Bacteroidota bacterium]